VKCRGECSEYRQAEGSVVSGVALRLLTTDAPADTTQDLAASAQLVSSTGRQTKYLQCGWWSQLAHVTQHTCWLENAFECNVRQDRVDESSARKRLECLAAGDTAMQLQLLWLLFLSLVLWLVPIRCVAAALLLVLLAALLLLLLLLLMPLTISLLYNQTRRSLPHVGTAKPHVMQHRGPWNYTHSHSHPSCVTGRKPGSWRLGRLALSDCLATLCRWSELGKLR